MSPQRDSRELAEFLLRLCHELRSPVRAVRTHAELLLRDAGASRAAGIDRQLGFIAGGVQRLDLLVDGLARYAVVLQMDAASFQPTPMDAMLRLVLAKLGRELREHDAQVTFGELPRVRGNPDRLMEVFEILLRNALAHRGEPSPLIEIAAEARPECWLFAVRDNGPGVEAAYLESIFRPFERLQRGKQGAGPGLGLSICRAIVERHGGRVWAESRSGGGTAFLFTLPKD